LTTTDLTVHVNGIRDIGDPSRVKDISKDVVEKGQNEIYRLLSVGFKLYWNLILFIDVRFFVLFRERLIE
jgi:hypothetical protein